MLRALGIALLLSSAGACGATTPIAEAPEVAGDDVPEEQESILGVVEQYRQAYEVGSADALESLYSQDLDLVLVYQGRAYHGWTAVHGFVLERVEGKKVRMSIKDVAIREVGTDTAVVTATRTSTIGDGAVSVTESGQLTLVLHKEGEAWLVVSEHFSYPMRRS